jgi:hypothetical protein
VHDVRVNDDGVLEWDSEKPRLHKQVSDYFNNRKEGPKPNNTHDESDEAWAAQMKSLSRGVRSWRGYHCHRPEYREPCKIAFRMWGEAMKLTQLQVAPVRHTPPLRPVRAVYCR